MTTFSAFALKPELVQALEKNNFLYPTEVQQKIIPLILQIKNIIVESPTGSGKTHSFLVPILNTIQIEKAQVQAIIISPTRELAQQIYTFLKVLLQDFPAIKAKCFVGGKDVNKDIDDLQKNQPHIIIATPTRLRALYENNYLKITTANKVVIDECDMIFSLGFIQDLDYLLNKMHRNIQIMVFSATIPPKIKPFLEKYLGKVTHVKIDSQKFNQNINHILVNIKTSSYDKPLLALLKTFNPYLCLIFVNKKIDIDHISKLLTANNFKIAVLHGDLAPRERIQIFKRIRNLEFQYVLCSDIAARGIDILGISHVISLDLPFNWEYYIHRAGRIRDLKFIGLSYVLYHGNQSDVLHKIEQAGIKFSQEMYQKDKFIPLKFMKPKPQKISALSQLAINRFKKNSTVKPGYKQKLQNQLQEIKQTEKREKIRSEIRKMKKQKAIERQKKLFNDDK